MHLCFAIGSVLASVLVSAFVVAGFRWDRVFQLLGIIAIGSGTFFLFTDAGAPSSKFDASTLKSLLKKYKQLLGEKKLVSLLVANTLAIGTQFGTIYLLVLFLTSTRGLPQAQASLVLAVYFVLLGTGRIVCSSLITRYPITKIVTFLLILLFSSLLAGWLTRGPVSIVCFAITGLASSGLMPSLLALASHMLPKEVTGLALGVLSMFGGLGGMGLMKLVTWLAGFTGLNTAFLAVVFVALSALLYFLAIRGRYRVYEEGKT